MNRRGLSSLILGLPFASSTAWSDSLLPHVPRPLSGSSNGTLLKREVLQEKVEPIICPNGYRLQRPTTEPTIGHGKFSSDPIVRLTNSDRLIVVVNEFIFTQSNSLTWPVPAGTVSDGASIPRLFWSLVGAPLDGPYRDAAIVHDYYCDVRTRTWQDTHRVFLDGMLSIGVDSKLASKLYYAVYHFGPKWNLQAICNTRRSIVRDTYSMPYEAGVSYAFAPTRTTVEVTDPIIEEKFLATPVLSKNPIDRHVQADLNLINQGNLSVAEIETLGGGD